MAGHGSQHPALNGINHPGILIPYCKDDLEVRDSADESSPSNSEGPSTSKTKVESRLCHYLTIICLIFVVYVAFGESLCEYEHWESRQERSRCIQLAYIRSNMCWPMRFPGFILR